jgi:hypothetical protein
MGHKPVTATMVTASMPAGYKLKVTSVMPAIMRAGPSTTGHPVTAIFPGVLNPVDYMASNASNVIGCSSDPDSSMSTHLLSPTVDATIPMVANVLYDVIVPLAVPHMFRRASVISPAAPDNAPIQFDCLIDNGLHLVLICDSQAEQLCLHHHKLPLLIETKVVMREGDKKVILKLYEYVKLHFYDSTGEYTAKSIHAIIQWLKKLSQCLAISNCSVYNTMLRKCTTLNKMYLIVYHIGFQMIQHSCNLDKN